MMDSFLSCATCSANFQDNANAASWSILFLLAVIVLVLGGVIGCMIRLIRRDGRNLDPELCDDFEAFQEASPSASR
ncbi:hypothetical protein HNR46_004075 [Haloferula luteola]|uniref:Transmembrane protein n=1 Tax=Haloferula luteola TaxID=595692 RepID=A0A840V758_9BACT|nr:hypothetical protein [Haloferula luteola]MBB5353812.1 hypothetical protein [Haloferula luteola]